MSYLFWRLRRLVTAGKVLIRDGNTFRGILPEDVATSVDVDPETDGDLDLGSDASHRWRTLRLATSMILSASGTVVVGANTLIGAVADKLNAAHLAIASQAVGDILYAATTTTFARLAAVGAGQVLVSAGVGTAPAWSASPSLTALTLSGDIAAAGGFRQTVGGFSIDPIGAGDNATPASSTPVACNLVGVAATHPAARAGSIMGLGFMLDTDPAGSAIVVAATIDGVVQAATASTLAAGSTRHVTGTFAKDAVTFTAGQRLGLAVRTGSGWSATTAMGVGYLQIED
ncbi:MAG: hypothetical protein Q8S73_36895 [Deltaproteobacteria bacterium]|nr:hypothetical protein [Myxococcales bacterium]MDP3219738.1 hypothetical protein [Deltaproteobacteria bacterium]